MNLIWFRRDLRLNDNQAWSYANASQEQVLPLYIEDADDDEAWPMGGASRWWLHHALKSLEAELKKVGSSLKYARAKPIDIIPLLCRQFKVQAVFWNRVYEPAAIARDTRLKEQLRSMGIKVESFNGLLLREPWEVKNQSGRPFQVFTPFWKSSYSNLKKIAVHEVPKRINSATIEHPKFCVLSDLNLLPDIKWDTGFYEHWQPQSSFSWQRFESFLRKAGPTYDQGRDRPDIDGTSTLSPYLHFGQISVRHMWNALLDFATKNPKAAKGLEVFRKELVWREFAYHLLFHFPKTPTDDLKPDLKFYRWRKKSSWLRAWQRGETGYPIVDAGMRQLWQTGWMHNRVRMIVASFLIKDLRMDWRQGARWFWDTLVDADLASNTLGWQWTAGCGADASPFFRIFNPTTQASRFDPSGAYIKRFVPELNALSGKDLYEPWNASSKTLKDAGIVLGKTYPKPLVHHDRARKEALAYYERSKARARGLVRAHNEHKI